MANDTSQSHSSQGLRQVLLAKLFYIVLVVVRNFISREPNGTPDELQYNTDGHRLRLSHQQLESMFPQKQALWAQEDK